jgi:hypothetical protein
LKKELEKDRTLLESKAGPRIRKALKSIEDAWGKCPHDTDLSLITGVEGPYKYDNGNVSCNTENKDRQEHGVKFYIRSDELVLKRYKAKKLHGPCTFIKATGKVVTWNYKDGGMVR